MPHYDWEREDKYDDAPSGPSVIDNSHVITGEPVEVPVTSKVPYPNQDLKTLWKVDVSNEEDPSWQLVVYFSSKNTALYWIKAVDSERIDPFETDPRGKYVWGSQPGSREIIVADSVQRDY